MVNYQNGKIYMIMTENSNEIYIGSTTQTLKRRLKEHESRFRRGVKYYSSYEILKQGNYKIVLIKKFACNSLIELEAEETKFQKDLVCVNNRLARMTEEEKRQYQKHYKSEKFDCVCGGKYTRRHKSEHLKYKKHLDYLESIKNQKKIVFKIKK